MPDEKEKLPSDAEKGGLKPMRPEEQAAKSDIKPPPQPESDKTEEDPSEQPS